jgi:hypothetical protein
MIEGMERAIQIARRITWKYESDIKNQKGSFMFNIGVLESFIKYIDELQDEVDHLKRQNEF